MHKSFKYFPLKLRLALGLGSLILPIALIGGATVGMFQAAINTFEQTEEERREVLFPLVDLDASITNASSYLDRLSINTSQQTLNTEEWQQFQTLIQRDLVAVSNIPEIVPVQAILINSIETNLSQAFQLIEMSQDEPLVSQAESQVKTQQNIQTHLQNALGGVRNVHYSLAAWSAKENIQRAEDFKWRLRWMVIWICVTIAFLALLASLILTRSILKPIKQLKEGLEHFSQGDLGFRIQLETHDEIEDLAHSMNEMASNLEKSQQRFQELAIKDDLTGLLNRREFNRLLTIEVDRAIRDQQSVSLIMLDLDHFKTLNDTYGHQTGDTALQQMANLVKCEVRPGDYVARFGGEEFALILPNATIEDAQTVAERVREAIANHPIHPLADHTLQVTASLGCAAFPSHAQSESSLLTQADKALYHAKDLGRNQVVLASALVTSHNYG